MAGEISAHIQSILADNLTNLSATNPNIPSQHVRKEGWTEVFGNLSARNKSTSTMASSSEKVISISTNKEPQNIQIIQYRMSWTSQLLLRIYSIPHQVFNTPYLSNQCTGAYPQYRNLSSRLVIGNHDILPHLMEVLKAEEFLSLSIHQTSESHCLSSLLDQLDFILKGLRYGDKDAWDNIYRQQCIRGSTLHKVSSDHDSVQDYDIGVEEGGRCNGFAWFQAWAERSVYLNEVQTELRRKCNSASKHGLSNLKVNEKLDVKQLIQLARKGYAALDSKLERGDGTLLGTESLTLEDIRLFGHLAEALCDVNLVSVLEEMKNLVTFFQKVYQKYFGKDYLKESIADGENANDEKFNWIKANNKVNAMNQFNRVPINGMAKVKSSPKGDGYKDAIEIMQTVALHCHDLQEVLSDMALQRKEEDALKAKNSISSKSGTLFHKWRMGGDLEMNTNKDDTDDDGVDDDITRKNKEHMKKMMKEAKKNDEIWISGVICATAIGLLASTNAAF